MGWTRADIRAKIRNITGSPSPDQITDDELNTRINDYMVFTMPFELKVQIENQFLQFKTVPGQDIYSFPGGYFTDSPGAYADGFPLIFYQDPDIFFQDWPQQYAVDNIATGDGVTNSFSGQLQSPPIIMGSLFFTDGTQVLQDQGNGTLTGNGSGTINYITGAYNFSFTVAPASSDAIYAKYQGYQGNRPQGVMFFNNEFTLRPIPDQVYQILMQGYIKPQTLDADGDIPLQEEWGPVIAYGASLEIFNDRGDSASFEQYISSYNRYMNVAQARTIQQYTEEQAVPRF